MTFEKLKQDGNVAVLCSPGYGAGWYTWNKDNEGLIFDKEIAVKVLEEDKEAAIKIAKEKYPEIYTGGGQQLQVAWVPEGSRFLIDEYDGSESIRVLTPDYGILA